MIHLKLALRTLIHYRMYSIINLLGLAISLTCVIIIARYVYSEMTVDKFNSKLDRIYTTTSEWTNQPGKIAFSGVTVNKPRRKDSDITKNPGIEKLASFVWTEKEDIEVENRKYNVKLLGIDTVFLQILDYPVKAGINILRPEEALITEAFAAKIFGREDPLGKTFFYPAKKQTFTVAGIIRTPAYKSSLSFDILISLQFVKYEGDLLSLILLYPGVDYKNINRQYSEFTEQDDYSESTYRHQLFPYCEVYFDKHITSRGIATEHYFAHGNPTHIFILSGIGILLLLIGLANYVNIHSVVMTRRNRELGMKKVFGAEGFKIFAQLLLENLMLTVSSIVIAFWFTEALSPFMENSLGVLQYPNLRFDLSLGLTLAIALPVMVSIVPYLRYRYFSPVRSLQSVGAGNKSLLSRKFYLCLQYFMTIVLITVSLFFVKQLNFMLDKDLGFRTHDIIKVPFLKIYNNFEYFEESKNSVQNAATKSRAILDEINQKLDASPLITHFVRGGFPSDGYTAHMLETSDGRQQNFLYIMSTEEWFKVFEIKLLEGRLWNSETDKSSMTDVIVNESALKQLDLTDYNVVGVVSDFHTEHLSKQLMPTIFIFSETGGRYYWPVIASFVPGRRQEVIEFMKNLHDELVNDEFEYSFIEDEIAKMYGEDKKVSIICTAFTGMAILISMLGLLGVSLFDIRQRRKEIAIRKIHGAMMKDIISLLLKKYFVLLGLAFVVSTPVALFVIMKYLEGFAYKAPVSWWLFAVALVATVVVSLLTLIWQAYKAGLEPPAEVVKS